MIYPTFRSSDHIPGHATFPYRYRCGFPHVFPAPSTPISKLNQQLPSSPHLSQPVISHISLQIGHITIVNHSLNIMLPGAFMEGKEMGVAPRIYDTPKITHQFKQELPDRA